MEFVDARTAFPVPALFKAATVEEWQKSDNDTEAGEAAVEWYQEFLTFRLDRMFAGNGLVLIGPPGTGKTYLASALLNDFYATGRATAAFVTDQTMAPLMRKRDYDEESDDVWSVLTRVSCVVWDDILRFGVSESAAEGFLRARHARGVPTIITINNDLDVGRALTSFLSTFTWAEFKGKDLRR